MITLPIVNKFRATKVYALSLGGLLLLLLAFFAFYKVALWFDSNKLVFDYPLRVQFYQVVKVEKREPELKFVAITSGKEVLGTSKTLVLEDKKQLVKQSDLSWVIDGVWFLETNRGQNTDSSAHHNDCSKVGMSNEFGFGALNNYCFDSFEESVTEVTAWFKRELKTKSLNEALCYYNSGKAESTCDYAISFARLDSDAKLASK